MGKWPVLPSGWEQDPAVVAKYRELLIGARIKVAKQAMGKEPPSLADDENEKKLHESLSTLAVGSVDRARDGAKFVETAAAAIGTVYTGILGLVFSASGRPLPGRGVYAAIFLGIAIVGTAYYLAFIRRTAQIGRPAYQGSRPEDQWRRTEWFSTWVGDMVRNRAGGLHVAVVSLALGVAFMPFPFLADRLAHNPLALTESASATAAPTATVTIAWPSPPSGIANPELAALLYQAQLNRFEKTLDSTQPASSPADGTSTDELARLAFLVGLAVLALVGVWGWIMNAIQVLRRDVIDARRGRRRGITNPDARTER